MRHLMGLILGGGILLATAAESQAQFSITIGSPYAGQGYSVGSPAYGYNSGNSGYNSGYSGYNGLANSGYNGLVNSGYNGSYNTGYANSGYANSGYANGGYASGYSTYSSSAYVAGPGTMTYNSGYRGYAPAVVNYGYAPAVPYHNHVIQSIPYGYGNASRPYYGGNNFGGNNFGGSNFGIRQLRGIGGLFR